MTVESEEPRAEGRELRSWPRDLIDQLWDVFPTRFESMWPFEGLRSHDVGRPLMGAPIRMEELRDGDEVVVRAELPGIDPEKDVEVTVEGGLLTISAHREERTEDKQKDSYRSEFRYGHLERQIRLPEGTGPEAVSATYTDGVLEVRLPAPRSEGTTRRIAVTRG
jgi:HSP20 family protein